MRVLRIIALIHSVLMIVVGGILIFNNSNPSSFGFIVSAIYLLAGIAQLFYASNTQGIVSKTIVDTQSLDNIYLYSKNPLDQISGIKPLLIALAFFCSAVLVASAYIASRQLSSLSSSTPPADLIFRISSLTSGLCAVIFNMRTWNLSQITKA